MIDSLPSIVQRIKYRVLGVKTPSRVPPRMEKMETEKESVDMDMEVDASPSIVESSSHGLGEGEKSNGSTGQSCGTLGLSPETDSRKKSSTHPLFR